jgi:hypothetical protein
VFPTANPKAAKGESDEKTLTRKAAAVIAGQQRQPKSSRQARATPDAGQMGEMLLAVNGTAKPSIPAKKYRLPVTPSRKAYPATSLRTSDEAWGFSD